MTHQHHPSDCSPTPISRSHGRLGRSSVGSFLVATFVGCMLAAVGVGCGPVEEEHEPSLVILSPGESATLCGLPLAVKLELEGASLGELRIASGSVPSHEETGTHIDVFLDDTNVAMESSVDFEIANVSDGNHVLTVELVDSHHEPLDPPVGDEVSFMVDNTNCADEP